MSKIGLAENVDFFYNIYLGKVCYYGHLKLWGMLFWFEFNWSNEVVASIFNFYKLCGWRNVLVVKSRKASQTQE